jgi:hypothetical protein
MTRETALTTTSLLAIALSACHFAQDMARGIEPGNLANTPGVLMLAAWSYGALSATGKSRYVLLALGACLGMLMTVAHMRGAGVGTKLAGQDGAFAVLIVLVAMGTCSAHAFVLAVQEWWGTRHRATA